ncbi:hypothetical protein OKW49_003594 [Paraburkholderia youngii]
MASRRTLPSSRAFLDFIISLTGAKPRHPAA